jgi:DNA-binding NarL/FixJ family response regulator
MPFNVLLVDDHKIMRDGIKAILRSSEEFHVTGEAESGLEAIHICEKQQPHIVLMDLALLGTNGIETTAELLRLHPGIKIIMLSMYDDEHSVVGAIRSGARGFVVKNASSGDLVDALRMVANGGSYLSPKVSDRLLNRVRSGALEGVNPSGNALENLAPREHQVLRLVAEGRSSKEIAVQLRIAVDTVRSYRKTMMRKLAINNVAELTQLALASGITHFLKPESDEKTNAPCVDYQTR